VARCRWTSPAFLGSQAQTTKLLVELSSRDGVKVDIVEQPGVVAGAEGRGACRAAAAIEAMMKVFGGVVGVAMRRMLFCIRRRL
jgi:hypothetical protein